MPDEVLDGYDIEKQVGFLLRRAHQRHIALFQDAMARYELTPTQFNALIRVVELGAVTQNHLGRLAAMDPATIQGVVRRMVERNLMERRPDPMDKRTTVLSATAAGRALAEAAVQAGLHITAATLAPLSAQERRSFLTLLGKMT